MKPKIQIQVRDIMQLFYLTALINRTPLTRIQLMDGHRELTIDENSVKKFLYTGLSNEDFFRLDYQNGLIPEEVWEYYHNLTCNLDYKDCKEAEQDDLNNMKDHL